MKINPQLRLLSLLICLSIDQCFADLKLPIERPNIIFVLTDDQDVTLGGLTPMIKTKEFFSENGVQFVNSFTAVPICCPSRSSILTGKYQHNHQVLNNSLSGNCYGSQWRNEQEKNGTIATHLHAANYTTFFAGKYLNQYGIPASTETKFVPPGWTHWIGLVGNSVYYNYSLSVNGHLETHASGADDYLTDLINARASDFLEEFDPATGKPFFMMLSTPACHGPFTASQKHIGQFSNLTAPRTPNFNISGGSDKHWLLRQTPALSENTVNIIDDIFGKRWATLLSVDDMVGNLVGLLRNKGLLNSTYIFFSSDNGYHLGQFSLPIDKRQMYEFDVRVPLLVAGPGIRNGTLKEPVVNVDLAPTFLELAGLSVEATQLMDGKSLVPLLFANDLSNCVVDMRWRTSVLIEYHGEGHKPGDYDQNCPQYIQGGVSQCFPDCICEDAFNNTYSCIRTITSSKDLIFCIFEDDESFVEVYNLTEDPHQLNNIAYDTNDVIDLTVSDSLRFLETCRGQACHI